MALNAYLNQDIMDDNRMPPAGAQQPSASDRRKLTEYLLQFVAPNRRQRYVDMAEAPQ